MVYRVSGVELLELVGLHTELAQAIQMSLMQQLRGLLVSRSGGDVTVSWLVGFASSRICLLLL